MNNKYSKYEVSMKKFYAFTLAEVLITLGIIGVVAAMTLPTLTQKQNERETVVRLKKAYSLLSQAVLAEMAENGTVDTWGLGNTDSGQTDNDGNIIADISGKEKFTKILHKHLKSELYGTTTTTIKQYNLNGDFINALEQDNGVINGAIRLSDGTILLSGYTYGEDSGCKKGTSPCVDVTALMPNKKGEYTQGITSFPLRVYRDRVVMSGYQNAPSFEYPFETNCVGDKTKRQAGRGCTAWVIINENMDYLRCPEKLGWDKARSCKE